MITTLINADEVELEKDMEAGYRDMAFQMKYPRLYRILEFRFMLRYFLAYHLVCRHLGHDLVDNGSSFGPDSGTEDLVCTRCGFSFHHCYYRIHLKEKKNGP